jgi:hypothetical protein
VEVEVEGERWVTDLHYEVLESDGEKSAGGRTKLKKRNVGSKGGSKEIAEQEKEVLRRAWEESEGCREDAMARRSIACFESLYHSFMLPRTAPR